MSRPVPKPTLNVASDTKRPKTPAQSDEDCGDQVDHAGELQGDVLGEGEVEKRGEEAVGGLLALRGVEVGDHGCSYYRCTTNLYPG